MYICGLMHAITLGEKYICFTLKFSGYLPNLVPKQFPGFFPRRLAEKRNCHCLPTNYALIFIKTLFKT